MDQKLTTVTTTVTSKLGCHELLKRCKVGHLIAKLIETKTCHVSNVLTRSYGLIVMCEDKLHDAGFQGFSNVCMKGKACITLEDRWYDRNPLWEYVNTISHLRIAWQNNPCKWNCKVLANAIYCKRVWNDTAWDWLFWPFRMLTWQAPSTNPIDFYVKDTAYQSRLQKTPRQNKGYHS